MAEYDPFKDYFGIRSQLFDEGKTENRRLSSQTESAIHTTCVNDYHVTQFCPNPPRRRYTNRTVSYSSADSDVSADVTSRYSQNRPMQGSRFRPLSSVSDDSGHNACSSRRYEAFPMRPTKADSRSRGHGRPILPQKLPSRQPSPEPETRTFAETDVDKKELVSTSTDLGSSRPQTSSFAGMMERLVHDAVEKKFTDTANRISRPTCFFCQRNGETVEYYTTHMLKDTRGKVVCPVLRKYVCPKCHATGDNAHTLRHCPLSKNTVSVSETFKTPRTSCGVRKPPF